jgi:membrane protease YdiL (CAAX protease family)
MVTTTQRYIHVDTPEKSLVPMGWIETGLAMLFPTAGMIFAHYAAYPYLKSLGIAPYISYMAATIPVMIGMLLAALIGYHREGHAWTWEAFAKRFRLGRPNGRVWLWTGAAVIAYLLLGQLANTLLMMIYQALAFTPPTFAFGAPIPLLAIVGLAFNIIGEEFWWRGYILPRQEAHFGRWAWLVNGTIWAFFHLYKWWGLPGMLIVCQIIPFLSQRLKNNWPALLLHFLLNGLGILIAIAAILIS